MISKIKRIISRLSQSKIGICFICDNIFKNSDLILVEDMAFCKEDLIHYQEEKWLCMSTIESNPQNPEQAILLTEIKEFLKIREVKSFVTVNYKDREHHIITEFSLYIPERFTQNYKIAMEEFSVKKI